jgi:hypothetical protein
MTQSMRRFREISPVDGAIFFVRRMVNWLSTQRKLLTGHSHAEKLMLENVWWPAFGHFDHLHPEYEVNDYFDGKRYIDFAFIRSGLYIAIEVDPYGTHHLKLDKRQYSNQWVRQMHLFNDSWRSYESVMTT